MQLSNAVAIVTGGASGLGAATVAEFIGAGARVAIFDRDRAAGRVLADRLGEAAAFYEVDVTDAEGVTEAVAAVTDRWGGLHVCCNYAGIAPAVRTIGRQGPAPLADFSRVIGVNLIGTFNVCRVAAYAMADNQADPGGNRGIIINTASAAAYEGQIGQVAYSASKGGVVSMTLTMARDLARNGIRVMAIAPGLVHTPLFDGFSEEVFTSLSEQPLYPKRLGQPTEVARLARHIVENDYLNGECIRLDAGLRMQPR